MRKLFETARSIIEEIERNKARLKHWQNHPCQNAFTESKIDYLEETIWELEDQHDHIVGTAQAALDLCEFWEGRA